MKKPPNTKAGLSAASAAWAFGPRLQSRKKAKKCGNVQPWVAALSSGVRAQDAYVATAATIFLHETHPTEKLWASCENKLANNIRLCPALDHETWTVNTN